jgi:hypothetical protein
VKEDEALADLEYGVEESFEKSIVEIKKLIKRDGQLIQKRKQLEMSRQTAFDLIGASSMVAK